VQPSFDSQELVSREDIETIFSKLSVPSLMLTNLKVKKSKQAVQDAFSVLNHNMLTIDRNFKDLLFLVQELAQVLYVFMDSRIAKLKQNAAS